jgi:hypothetical protein
VPKPVLSLATTDATGGEAGATPIVFVLTRTVNLNGTVVVPLTWSGTALSTDYTVSVSGGTLNSSRTLLTLASGVGTVTITITPVDDTLVELTESVGLALGASSAYTLGTSTAASGTILDNDVPWLTISSGSVVEGNSGTTTVTLTVTLSSAAPYAITANYATASGTATAGTDFASTSGTLSFAAGVTSRTITFTVYGDKAKEGNETFTVKLSSPSGATIAAGTGTVTIVDDEKALTASAAPTGTTSVASLSRAQLDPVISLAKASWLAAMPGADLSGVMFEIADLDGLMLGITNGRTVMIDVTAAGWGWGAGGMDLLTVVSHELGHVLGLDHDGGLMADTLAPGQVEAPAWITASKPGRIGAHTRVAVGKHLRAPHARPGTRRLPR